MPSITLMIPALNEERRIGSTLETVLGVLSRLPGVCVQVLVIDDGSTDGTAAVVRRYAGQHPAVELVQHDVNRGLGQAFRTALAHAKGDKFLIVPGDNDMPAATLRALLDGPDVADMTLCFFLNREQRGRVRNLLSTGFGLIYATVFDVYVQYINGPCVYPVKRLRELNLVSTRFSIVAEINIKLLRQGVSFIEVPSYRQTGLAGSTSFSFRNLRETARVFCHLVSEVHIRSRARYAHRPVRIIPPLT